MVAWYKHDIPAWMDGTESLSDGEYRAYHTICQLIYLNEGPITLNEHGIAGRCCQHILSFRSNLKKLLALGKLVLTDGRLSNNRAAMELQYVAIHRAASAKGGRRSAGVPKSKPTSNPQATSAQPGGGTREVGGRLVVGTREVDGRFGVDVKDNPLKRNGSATVPLLDPQHQETRLEESREEKKDICAVAKATRTNPDFEIFKKSYPRRQGSNPWKPAEPLFEKAVKRGTPAETINRAAEAYATECRRNGIIDTEKVAQAQTWLRQERYSDYVQPNGAAAIPTFDIRKHLV